MSPEGSTLDLNNLPEDYTRDVRHDCEDTSTSGQRRKKRNGKDNESGKIYECRFCSLKFGKSQALGGHMNRHRQERETETLNKARQLVYSSDQNLSGHPSPSIGACVPQGAMVYSSHPSHQVYPSRPVMYSGQGSTAIQPPRRQHPHHEHQSHAYTSSTPPRLPGDYYLAHGHSALGGPSHVYNSDPITSQSLLRPPVGIKWLGPKGQSGLDRDECGLVSVPWDRSYLGSDNLGSNK